MKFSIKDFFSKCDQIRSKVRILSYLLKKSLMENFIFLWEICSEATFEPLTALASLCEINLHELN